MSEVDGDDLELTLARRIAHAIRTPLGVVSGAFAQLSGAELDPTNTTMVELGQRAGAQLERIADRLSLLSRLAREPDHAPTSCDPATVTLAAAQLVARARVRRRVTVDLDPVREARGRGSVQADPKLLEAAIAELIDNAVRFAKKSVRVAVEYDDTATITVDNDGPSLPEDDPLTPDGSGLGIGLRIAEDIARRHGARIDHGTRDDPERTVFSFRFPARD